MTYDYIRYPNDKVSNWSRNSTEVNVNNALYNGGCEVYEDSADSYATIPLKAVRLG